MQLNWIGKNFVKNSCQGINKCLELNFKNFALRFSYPLFIFPQTEMPFKQSHLT